MWLAMRLEFTGTGGILSNTQTERILDGARRFASRKRQSHSCNSLALCLSSRFGGRLDMAALPPTGLGRSSMKAVDVMVREVVAVTPDTDVAEAVKLLGEHDVSALPVVDEDGNS
jgi:CBS domain-containing protein